jgi:hypothetical protein
MSVYYRFSLSRVAQWVRSLDYIMATSFSGGSRSTLREPPTMGKQLVNFITCGCESSGPYLRSRTSHSLPPCVHQPKNRKEGIWVLETTMHIIWQNSSSISCHKDITMIAIFSWTPLGGSPWLFLTKGRNIIKPSVSKIMALTQSRRYRIISI